MKKRIIIIIAALILAGILFQGIYLFDKNKKPTDAQKFKEEYEALNGKKSPSGNIYRSLDISSDNKIKYSSAKEIVEKINNDESFIVYFGFAKCPWCRSMIENLLALAKEYNVDVYYVDVLEIRDTMEVVDGEVKTTKKGDKNYMKLLDSLGDVLSDYSLEVDGVKYETNEKRIYAPNVVTIVQGKAEKMNEGISKDLKDPYGKITDKMKKESAKQLECNFKCLEKAGICTKPNAC